MQTSLAPSSLPTPTPQRLHHVLRAEGGRAAGRGGLLMPAVAASALGVFTGVGIHAVSVWMSSSPELGEGMERSAHAAGASGMEAAAVVAALVLSLAAIVRVSRDQGPSLGAMLLLVPRRGRLLTAQLLMLALAAALVLTATVTLSALAIAGLGGTLPAVPMMTTGIVSVVAGVAVVLLAAGLATAVRSLPVALLVFIGLLVVVPLLFSLAPLALPAAAGKAIGSIGAWLPMQAWVGGTAVSSLGAVAPGTVLPLLGRLCILGVWTAAAVAAGWALLRRREV